MKKNIIFHPAKDKILTSKETKVDGEMVIFKYFFLNLLHNKYQRKARE